MSALRRLWDGPFGVVLLLMVLMVAAASFLASRTCGRDPAPLGVRGTLDDEGRFVPAEGRP